MSRLEDLSANLHYIGECLATLDEILKLPNCQDCAKLGACEYQAEWGKFTRFNCPLWESNGHKLAEGTISFGGR